jgi:hypothetical protein
MTQTQPLAESATNGAQAGLSAPGAAEGADLLRQWIAGIRLNHIGHRRAATVYARRARALGVITTLASTIVGTTLFSSLANSQDSRLIVAAAIASLFALVASALQTFLNYSELAAAHRGAAVGYGALRRRSEQLLAFPPDGGLDEPMRETSTIWNKLDEESPELPDGMFEYANRWVARRNRTAKPPKGQARPAEDQPPA